MYNCKKCPGYCCSYPLIALDKRDVERLAKHFDLTFEQAKAKFTVERHGRKYSMRRKADQHFGRICTLLRHRKALLHDLRGAPVRVPQLSRRPLRLLRLPLLRAARAGGPGVRRHHRQHLAAVARCYRGAMRCVAGAHPPLLPRGDEASAPPSGACIRAHWRPVSERPAS